MRRAALLLASVLLLATPASPQQYPGRAVAKAGGIRYATSGGVGSSVCQAQNNGVTAYLCVDFANGSYVLNGTSYASFTAMGGTVPAGCTITPSSGANCPAFSAFTIPAQNPASGYMLVTDYSGDTSKNTMGAVINDGSNNRIDSIQLGASRWSESSASGNCAGPSGSNGEDAIYVNSTTTRRCSAFNTAVTSASGSAGPTANATLHLAGLNGSNFTIVPSFFVRSVRIYVGTFSDAQIQSATLQ